MSNPEYDLHRQTDAARGLLASLRDHGDADDLDLVEDTIEGETDLKEAIANALDEIDEWTVLETGLKAKIEADSARLGTIQRRIDRIRAAIEQAMVMVDLPNLKLATATLSISKRKPGLVVENEALIPARFFVQPDPPSPKLDKKALAAALAEGPIDGARLDNGSVSLTVRRK